MSALWNALVEPIIGPMVLALVYFYDLLGRSGLAFAVSIAVLTIVVRLLLLPLSLPSQRSARENAIKMKEIQPRLDALKKKYKDDPRKLQEAQLKLYQEAGINPLSQMSGCLWLLIQFPIIIAFYQAIARSLADQPGQLLVLAEYLGGVSHFAALVPLQSRFLWMNLARPDPYYVIPLIVAGSTWLQQKLATPPTDTSDPQAAAMTQSMQLTMPIMFGFFAMSFSSGLGIYFVIGNLVGMAIQWGINRWLDRKFGQHTGGATTKKSARSRTK